MPATSAPTVSGPLDLEEHGSGAGGQGPYTTSELLPKMETSASSVGAMRELVRQDANADAARPTRLRSEGPLWRASPPLTPSPSVRDGVCAPSATPERTKTPSAA